MTWTALTGSANADCNSASNRFIHSVASLVAHERIHALNVQQLMVHGALAFPGRYGAVMPYLSGYAAIHDLPKSDPDIARLLCEIYGMNLEALKNLPKKRLQEIDAIRRRVIDQLNARELKLKREGLMRLGLLNKDGRPKSQKTASIIERIKELESVADNVERVANPISAEELGKSAMDPKHSFGNYMIRTVKRERANEMLAEAQGLLEHYDKNRIHYAEHARTLEHLDVLDPTSDKVLSQIVSQADASARKASLTLMLQFCSRPFADLLR